MDWKRWHRSKWLLLVGSMLSVPLAASPDLNDSTDQPLTVATINLPPLLGQDKGLLVDLVRQTFASQGVKTTFIIYPLSRISWSISKEKHCSTVGSLRWFDENKRKGLTAEPLYNVASHFFYLKGTSIKC